MTEQDGPEVDNGRPWYRVEMDAPEDPEPGGALNLEVTAGNGIQKVETIACLSLVLAAQLTGVPVREFMDPVNAYRRAAGLPPLERVAFEE